MTDALEWNEKELLEGVKEALRKRRNTGQHGAWREVAKRFESSYMAGIAVSLMTRPSDKKTVPMPILARAWDQWFLSALENQKPSERDYGLAEEWQRVAGSAQLQVTTLPAQPPHRVWSRWFSLYLPSYRFAGYRSPKVQEFISALGYGHDDDFYKEREALILDILEIFVADELFVRGVGGGTGGYTGVSPVAKGRKTWDRQ